MAGLWVGQAFGVLLLPGFGASSSSPPAGHPTSMCNWVLIYYNLNTTALNLFVSIDHLLSMF